MTDVLLALKSLHASETHAGYYRFDCPACHEPSAAYDAGLQSWRCTSCSRGGSPGDLSREVLGRRRRVLSTTNERETHVPANNSVATPVGPAERDVPRQTGFVLTRLGDLLAEPEERTPFMTDGLLPVGGVSLVVAKPKAGKSTAVRNLGMAVSSGAPFLGRATTLGAVVYLAFEDKRAEVASHFRRMGGSDQPILVHTGAAPASTAEGIAALEAAIVEHHAVLAIADPLLRLVRVRDSSDYAEMLAALEPIIELARRTTCHICATHHAGKMERGGGDDVLGSTAIFGSVDSLLTMRRREYGRTLQSIQRYGRDLDEAVVLLDESSGLIRLGGDIEGLKLERAKDAIREVLGEANAREGLDERTIKDLVQQASEVTGRALRLLVSEGILARLGEGKRGDPYRYQLAEDSHFLTFPIYEKRESDKTEDVDEFAEEPLPW